MFKVETDSLSYEKDSIIYISGGVPTQPKLDLTLQTLKTEHPNKKIEIEVDTFNQLEIFLDLLSVPVDAILLDNMSKSETIKCVQTIRQHLPNCFIESSGGINLENILNYKDVGVDGISIGALTHQAQSKNIKFEFKTQWTTK